MRIDQSHRSWALGTLAGLALSAALYVPYAYFGNEPPGGGTWVGLTYGTIGFLMMLFAGLLGLRKRFPVWRIGRIQNWMRAHLWLGLLSFPIIILHSAFALGGTLTTALMVIFLLVTLSGLLGAALQHFMPKILTAQAPMETIYDELTLVRKQLVEESTTLLDSLLRQGELTGTASRPISIQESPTAPVLVTEVDEESSAALRSFFETDMQPYLSTPNDRKHVLASPSLRKTIFKQLHALVPPDRHEILQDLENICEEKRQLDVQAVLHRLLHGWLLVHVPLSYLLLLLAAVHAVVALRY